MKESLLKLVVFFTELCSLLSHKNIFYFFAGIAEVVYICTKNMCKYEEIENWRLSNGKTIMEVNNAVHDEVEKIYLEA